MSRLDLVEASLLQMGKKCARNGDRITAQCPAHDDRSPSFSATLGRDGGVLFHCYAGCSGVDMMDALGLRWDQIKPDDYRGERVRRKPADLDTDSLIIEIARADRSSGKRLSDADKKREWEAFQNLKRRDRSVPEGMPTVMEIVRGANP